MEEFQRNVNDHYHTAGVAKAHEFAATDQNCPKAWAYREQRDLWRDKNMSSDIYKESEGVNVMWSREDAVQALAQFKVPVPHAWPRLPRLTSSAWRCRTWSGRRSAKKAA